MSATGQFLLALDRVAATVGTVLALTSSMAWFIYVLGLRIPESASRDLASGWGGLSPLGRVLLLILHSGTASSTQIGIFGWFGHPLPTLVVIAWVSVAAVASVLWWVGRKPSCPLGRRRVLGIGYLAGLPQFVGMLGVSGGCFACSGA